MKNFNKILALVLALMMLISVVVVVPASAAEVTFNTTALERLVKLGIYKGYGANELGENDDVTREQMAMFVARVSTGKVANDAWANFVNDTPFKDIADRPAVNIAAIAYAYDEGIIIGRSADVFDPKGNVSYQEALTMVVRALVGYEETKNLKYPEGFINAAIKMGLTEGISGVAYADKAIRGVTATILYNALNVEYVEWSWGPWEQINTFANKFNLSTGKYMLTSVTEERYLTSLDVKNDKKQEFTQTFPGTNACVDGDYVVFTTLNDDVTLDATADRVVLAAELADDLGADLAKKIGYVYDLTFEGEKLAWVDEYAGTTYKDYGKTENKITTTTVKDEGVNKTVLVVDNQKYDNTVDKVDLESKNPTKVYDLRLFEYNKTAMADGVAFVAKTTLDGVNDNKFQEVTLFDTNKDGMYDYGIYAPYYIGNRTTKKDGNSVEHFNMPTAADYDFQTKTSSSVDTNSAYNMTKSWNLQGNLTKVSTWDRLYVYKVNPVSMDIDVIQELKRTTVGSLTKIVNDALTGALKTVTVGGKEFANINVLTDVDLKGVEGAIAFEYADRMPTELRAANPVASWEGIFEDIIGNPGYGEMQIHELAGYTLIGWPTFVRNYKFVAFDWADAVFSMEDNILVVDRALTDASGNYKKIKIASIDNGIGGVACKTFDAMEIEAFFNTIDVLYGPQADLNQYNMYYNEARRAAIMATEEYAKQLRLNIMEEINGAVDGTPEFYAITGQDAAGNLKLTDVDYDNLALVSYATSKQNNNSTVKTNTIEFINGIAKGQFATDSQDTKIVSKSSNIVVTDSTVFTIVAADGIFTFTGKPDNGDKLDLVKATTFLIAANTSEIMLVDTTRSINQIAQGDVEYVGKFLTVDNQFEKKVITDTWAFNANTNNCPQGFKWLVDNAYLITSDTKLETVTLDGVVIYTYTNLYDLVACKNVEKTFTKALDLTIGKVVVVDRVAGIVENATLASVFHEYGANNVNWTEDTYVGKFVSGSTVGYYEFANAGKLIGVTPSFVIITRTSSKVTVSTTIGDLKEDATVYYTLVNGVPTGYAIQ